MKLSALMITASMLLPLSAMAEEAASSPEAGRAEYMKRVDGNSDGKISKDEYVAEGARRFVEIDQDKDGFASREEMKTHREKMRERFMERRSEREAKKKGSAL